MTLYIQNRYIRRKISENMDEKDDFGYSFRLFCIYIACIQQKDTSNIYIFVLVYVYEYPMMGYIYYKGGN